MQKLKQRPGELDEKDEITSLGRSLILKVKNKTARRQTVTLFRAWVTYNEFNNGLPDGVAVIGVYDLSEPLKAPISYNSFLCSILAAPVHVQISSSTNNRQLAFYAHQWHKPEREPIEPGLTKEGKQRHKKYGFEHWGKVCYFIPVKNIVQSGIPINGT